MKDMFGQDTGTISEGAPPADPPAPVATAPVVTATATAPAPAPGSPQPTLQQSVDKAVAKAAADAKVATDPHAVHSVKMAGSAPTVLGATAAGAVIGTAILPGPGTAVGALVGFVTEKYSIFGGPVGKLAAKVKDLTKGGWQKTEAGWTKVSAPGKLPKISLGGAASTTPATNVGQGQGS